MDPAPSHATRSPERSATFDDLIAVVRRLLSPDGCPWDRAQTPASLLPYLLEEAYEVRETVLDGDDAGLADELGDLALHVAFQVVLAEERGAFEVGAVFRGILDKMVRRHPRVFGIEPSEDLEVSGDGGAPHPNAGSADGTGGRAAAAGSPQWEEQKRRERSTPGRPGRLLAGIPVALPALLKAQRMQERAAGVGFDWPDVRGALEKLREELVELTALLDGSPAAGEGLEEEAGDLLFAAVNVCRKAGLAAEDALECANHKFRRRFERVESLARERGLEVAAAGLPALDALWEEVKRGERDGAAGQD